MKIDMFVFAILFAFAVCGTAQTEDEPTPPPTEEATDDLTEKVIEDLDRVLRNFERLYAEPGTDPGPEEELESIKPTLDPKLPIGDLPYFLKKGEHRLKFGVGYGVSAEIHGSGDVDEAEYVAYYPGWEIGLTDRVGGDAWYAGSVDLNIEGVFLDTKEPEDGFVGGGTLGFRYNFRELGPIVPYSGFGAGLADVDLDLEGLSDGLAFP
ncbi:MAG: hypothetical protein MK538_20865, partial [Planctomycetes bacterium]|nr:hypothetical protein [Planctomycetota bacterium]